MSRLCLLGVLAWTVCAAACGGGPPASAEAPVLVSAAVSLGVVLEELGALYTRDTGQPLRFNFAASNVLARQIVEGAAVDVFISADEVQMRVVEDAGLVDAASRVPLLANRLAVVVRSDWPHVLQGLPDLASPHVRRIALGDPAAVPAGVYARHALERAAVWSAVSKRVVPSVSVRAALAAVDEGHADAAIVYRTDVAAARRARLAFVVTGPEAPSIVYPAAVMTRARHGAAARRWLTWLRGADARRVFERFGFGVPPLAR